jgi:hypothetical protein
MTLHFYADTYRDERRRVRGVFVSARTSRRGVSIRFHWQPLVWSFNRWTYKGR